MHDDNEHKVMIVELKIAIKIPYTTIHIGI
jgi:hypothetical protein